LRRLVDFLDHRQEHGRQHVFLYQVDGEQQAYLETMADPQRLRKRLAALGLEDCVDQPRYVWGAHAPRLVEIRTRETGVLLLKWVETRHWLQAVPGQAEMVPRRQRAVHFFRVDLGTGAAELRLQRIERDLGHTLRKELETYRNLAGQLVDLHRFSPVLLEPAMRHFLVSDRFQVRGWRVELGGGQQVGGKGGGPKLLHTLLLAFRSFGVLWVRGNWCRARGERPLDLRLDGRSDEVRVRWETEKEPLDAFLGAVRERAPKQSPRGVGRIDHRAALAKVRQALDRQGKRTVPLKLIHQQTEGTALTPEEVRRAIESGSAQFPELLEAVYRVRCPESRRPVRRGGKILEFNRFAEIPSKIRCPHGSRHRMHPRDGNLLLYFPGYDPPPPQWSKLWPLLVLSGLLLGSTLAFAYILSFGLSVVQGTLVSVALLLVLVTEYILAQRILGQERILQAVFELGEIKNQFFGADEPLYARAWRWLRARWPWSRKDPGKALPRRR
jgi:hypothetical protein